MLLAACAANPACAASSCTLHGRACDADAVVSCILQDALDYCVSRRSQAPSQRAQVPFSGPAMCQATIRVRYTQTTAEHAYVGRRHSGNQWQTITTRAGVPQASRTNLQRRGNTPAESTNATITTHGSAGQCHLLYSSSGSGPSKQRGQASNGNAWGGQESISMQVGAAAAPAQHTAATVVAVLGQHAAAADTAAAASSARRGNAAPAVATAPAPAVAGCRPLLPAAAAAGEATLASARCTLGPTAAMSGVGAVFDQCITTRQFGSRRRAAGRVGPRQPDCY